MNKKNIVQKINKYFFFFTSNDEDRYPNENDKYNFYTAFKRDRALYLVMILGHVFILTMVYDSFVKGHYISAIASLLLVLFCTFPSMIRCYKSDKKMFESEKAIMKLRRDIEMINIEMINTELDNK